MKTTLYGTPFVAGSSRRSDRWHVRQACRFFAVDEAVVLSKRAYRDATISLTPARGEKWIDESGQPCFTSADFVDFFVHEVQLRLLALWLRRFGADEPVPTLLRDVDTATNRARFFALQRDRLPQCGYDKKASVIAGGPR